MNLHREPLVIRTAIVAAITGIIHALVVLGVLPITPEAETAVAAAIDLAGTAIAVVWSRGAVTPVADPAPEVAERVAADAYEPRHAAE